MSDAETRFDAVLKAFESGGPVAVGEVVKDLSHVEVVESLLVGFRRRALDLIVVGFAENGVHDMRPAGIPGMGVYRGRDEYRRFFEQWFEAFAEAEVVEAKVETADRADGTWCWFVHGTQRMAGQSSGIDVSFDNALVGIMAPAGPDRPTPQVIWSCYDIDVERARTLYEEVAGGTSVPEV